jgi:hypothetical protein
MLNTARKTHKRKTEITMGKISHRRREGHGRELRSRKKYGKKEPDGHELHKKINEIKPYESRHGETSTYWNITPSRPVKINRRFGGTYRPNHQRRRLNQARSQHV